MADDGQPPTDRKSPVGAAVIRGDASVAGEYAEQAIDFDPDDPESARRAADVVREFAADGMGAVQGDDSLAMLCGAAACAALVRAEGSYKRAAERAGGDASVTFIRKWARVHDLPRPIRRHVAQGHIPPSAAKHIARVAGDARYSLACAVLDSGLTVREVRQVASQVNDGVPVERALRECGVTPGELTVTLPADVYRELHRRASLAGENPDDFIAATLRWRFEEEED
ncbi:hypothetical protein ACFQH6_02010 [Halobacteriaceae archaeon GCM10025711]